MKKYSYDEAYKMSVDYFAGSEVSAKVYLDKYAMRDENDNILEPTPDYMHRRLSKEFARIDAKWGLNQKKQEQKYYESLNKFARIVAQGSPMSAIGNPYKIMSASNCVVVDSPEDSIDGIFSTAKETAELYKRRCGVGLDLSTLRPDGMSVNNAAKTTTGAWSFADFYSNVTRMIGQNSRRGATMLTLDVHHPDITKFITMKHDKTKVTGANVSVKLTDDFLNAVVNDLEYEQYWPSKDNKIISKKVKAKDIWQLIIDSATNTAEPGLLMWDTICKNIPAHSYPDFKCISTNPCCFAADKDVMVITNSGIKEIKSITSDDLIWVDSEKVWAKTSGYFNAGKAKTFKVTFSNHEVMHITENHKLEKVIKNKNRSIEYKLEELKNLKENDKISIHHNEVKNLKLSNASFNDGLILGWFVGDGCIDSNYKENQNAIMRLTFWENEHDFAYIIKNIVEECGFNNKIREITDNYGNKKLNISSSRLTTYLENKYNINLKDFKNGAKEYLYTFELDFIKGYLSAYFTADGTVQRGARSRNMVQLASVDFDRLNQVKNLLLLFGIKSHIAITKAKGSSIIRGIEYATQDLYRLSISGNQNIEKFNKHIKFQCVNKQSKLDNICSSLKETYNTNYITIKSIEEAEITDVGCIEVYDHHKFTANGIISGNSEIPLSKYDSCRLISINLTGYVKNAFEENAYFDFKSFKEDISLAMRMSDNLVELELELIKKIQLKCGSQNEKDLWQKLYDACEKGRRTGLGTHAAGDMLAQLKIKYASKESKDHFKLVYECLRNTAYQTSVDLAKERGAFPAFNWEIEKDNSFIKRLPDDIQESISKYGRRNISLLTQAPTGSVSMLSKIGEFEAWNTSSGIEPVFKNFYIRRKKINANDNNAQTDFIDALGDKWQEFKIFHGNVQCYLNKFNLSINELPEYFIESDKIDWVSSVELQAIAQEFIDHAISRTINLPKGTTSDVVGQIYIHGWKLGLKGVTVYVDGSRDGVLITESKPKLINDRPEKITPVMAPKRPQCVECDIFHVKVKGQKWVALVGLHNGKPYEIFTGFSSALELPSKFTTGKLCKTSKGHYDLHVDIDNNEPLIIKDIVKTFDNPEGAWTTRMISTSLRHGVPVDFLVEQLAKDGGIADYNKVLSRVLKKYIEDGLKVRTSAKCESCGSVDLVFQDGCFYCRSCLHSKCS